MANLITVKTASEKTGLSEWQISNAAKKGYIESVQLCPGGIRYVSEDSLMKAMGRRPIGSDDGNDETIAKVVV